MNTMSKWKKGRGKLGIFAPLLGTWHAHANSPQGPVHCIRNFQKVLDGSHVQLTATWHIGDMVYEEIAFFGCNREGKIQFWSFTSDGKQSGGLLAEVTDIHPDAIGFEAQMPAGLARQVYWPDEDQGFHWVVESHTKKGWNRFVDHHYVSEPEPQSVVTPE